LRLGIYRFCCLIQLLNFLTRKQINIKYKFCLEYIPVLYLVFWDENFGD
jgi:hypothetical protein